MFNDLKYTIKNSLIFGLGNAMAKLVGFLLIPLYTNDKYFTTGEFGLMGLLEVSVTILVGLMGMSLYSGLARWYWDDDYKDKKKSLVFTNLILTLCVSLFIGLGLWFNVGGLSGLLLKSEGDIGQVLVTQLPYIIKLLIAYSFFASIVEIPQTVLRLNGKAVRYTSMVIARLLTTLMLTVYFVVALGRGVAGIYEAQLIGVCVQFVLLLPVLLKNISFSVYRNIIGQFIRYSYPLVFPIIVGGLLSVFDRYALNYMKGLEDVAFYSLGFKIGNTIKVFIVMSIQLAITPIMMKKINSPDNGRFYSKGLTYFTYILMISVLSLNILSKEIIGIVTANKDYLISAYVVPFVSFGIIFGMMRDYCFIGLQITKRTKIMSLSIVIVTITNLVLNILFIPYMGIYGAAIATLIAQILSFLIIFFFAQKYYYIPYEVFKVFKIFVVGLLIFFLSFWLSVFDISWILLIFIKLLLISIFPFVLYIWKFYEDIELQHIRRMWRKWRNPRRFISNLRNL